MFPVDGHDEQTILGTQPTWIRLLRAHRGREKRGRQESDA
jgi:hypothetical protein